MTEGRVVVFGDVIDDVIVRPRGPVRADTDTSASIRSVAGGSAANTAAWLGSLGAAVDFVGSVGVDDVQRHTAALARHGVVPHLTGHGALPTGTIVIIVDGDDRSMLTDRGANSALHPDQVTDTLLDAAAVLHVTGYSVVDAVDPPAFRHLIERARHRGVAVSVDPGSAGFIADFGATRFLAAIAGATVVFPSREEARVLTGAGDARVLTGAGDEAAIRELGAQFPIVALTRGREGVLVAADDSVQAIAAVAASAPAVNPAGDPTGAGDAFCAGFLHEWLTTGDPVVAARAGALVAARAVGISGGRPPV